MSTEKTNIKRYDDFDVFCHANQIRKADLARMLGVQRQRINNIKNAAYDYVIEHNTKTNDVKIIRAESIIKECKLQKVEL